MKYTWALIALAVVFTLANVRADENPLRPAKAGASGKVAVSDLIRETQKMNDEAHKITIVWWIPTQYWRVAMEKAGSNERQIREIEKTFEPYTLVAVVDGTIGAMAKVDYASEEQVRSTLVLKDGTDKSYQPVEDANIDADTRNMLNVLRPVIANMLGPMGQHLYFIVFPAKDADGNLIADATHEGKFAVDLGDTPYKFRLPLGSLMPPKTCPKCGETLNGSYKFCPYDGTRLQQK